MEVAITGLIGALERVRIALLRLTLARKSWRRAYRSRAARLGILFLATAVLYFPLCLFFPVWVLAIGPLVWGVPHILAGFRFQARALGKVGPAFLFFLVLWLLSTAFRCSTDLASLGSAWDDAHPGIFEAALTAITFAGLWLLERGNFRKTALSALFFLPLAIFTLRAPLLTAGVLLLAHNFFAYVSWITLSRDPRDRAVAATAAVLLLLVHVAVLWGTLDLALESASRIAVPAWTTLRVDELGQAIATWSLDAALWRRCVFLYAFGQSLHYFVWLKAIPDLHCPAHAPASWRLSWENLKRDFGGRTALVACAISLVPILAWWLAGSDFAQDLYFAAASSHGYLEIVGLGWLLAKRV